MNRFASLTLRLKFFTALWIAVSVASIVFTLYLSLWLEGNAAAINALFPHLTVAQNIAFGLHRGLRTPSRRRARAEAAPWLEKMQLAAIADHYPRQISGGQRTALARTCAVRPDWLLLDEPFSALDTRLRAQMRDNMAALQRELDIPLLLITHDPEDAEVLADDTALIDNGRLRHGG